jgi:hypothetical protein
MLMAVKLIIRDENSAKLQQWQTILGSFFEFSIQVPTDGTVEGNVAIRGILWSCGQSTSG